MGSNTTVRWAFQFKLRNNLKFMLLFQRFAFMSGTNNDVEWVETTEEVVVTDDGPPSENHLAGMLKLPVPV